jgi:hypothetical protein
MTARNGGGRQPGGDSVDPQTARKANTKASAPVCDVHAIDPRIINSPSLAAETAERTLELLLELAERADDIDRYDLHPDVDAVVYSDCAAHVTSVDDWLLAVLYVRRARALRERERVRREKEAIDAAVLARRAQLHAVRGSKGSVR